MELTDEVLSPSISVVVPVHLSNESQFFQFERCLLSIKRLDPAPAEVIVVFDFHPSGAPARLMEQATVLALQSGVEVLSLAQPGGPSATRNIGARQASGDLLFFVDADCEAKPSCLSLIESTFAQDRELSALIGSYDDAPGAPNFLSQYKNLMHHWTHQNGDENASTFWGACGAIRRKLFLELGGFDEKYWFLEDVDLGYRLRRAGHKIRLVKDLQVKHLKQYCAPYLIKSDFCGRALPWTELILREKKLRGGVAADLNIDTSSRASVALVYAFTMALPLVRRSKLARVVALLCGISLLFLNWRTYRFLAEKRGVPFAVGSIFWHWLYFFYGGLGFIVGTIRFHSRQ